jgi:glycosyltransferase involved in cell wall biosynthesis
MRIAVCSGFEADSIKANALNVIKMAEGFASLGHEVLLIGRRDRRRRETAQSLLQRFGITARIQVRFAPWTAGNHERFAFHALARLLPFRPDFVYARSYVLPWTTCSLGIPTVAESHAFVGASSPQFHRLIRAGRKRALKCLVTIAPVLADYYTSLGVPKEKLLILPDAVDVDRFTRPSVLPPSPYPEAGRPNALYAGHLYDYKGIPVIIEAAKLSPEVMFHCLGGLPEDVQRQRNAATALGVTNIIFHGHVQHTEVPRWLWHADVLLLPPSSDHPSARWTSPMKLGEYMAAGVPVVASDIPALRNWVNESEVIYARPDNAESLAQGIRFALSEGESVKSRVIKAATLSMQWSFAGRAERIIRYASLER